MYQLQLSFSITTSILANLTLLNLSDLAKEGLRTYRWDPLTCEAANYLI
jgi:hypothetical protein